MAQENDMKEKPKRKRRTADRSVKEQPYVEQISELLMVHNKNDPKSGVGVISQADEKGNYKTVPPDEKNENSFLKFDKNSSILENFIRNFWSQFKEPTHFRLLRMTYHDYQRNKQAIKDLAEGKQTDAVKEFLKHYEIRPKRQEEQKSTNEKENASMAKKQEQQPQQPQQPQQQPEQLSQVQQAAQGMEGQQNTENQTPSYRYNEHMIDWEYLNKVGVSKEMLERSGVLDGMLKGYKTNKTIPLTLNINEAMVIKMDARLSFFSNNNGQVVLGVHGIRKEPELGRPYFGHNFTEEEKKNLRETGNLGHPIDLNLRGNTYEPCLVSIDRNTNELVAVRTEHVYIPNEIKGVKLEQDEINKLKNGEPVFVDGMTSAQGKEFSATLQYNAERRGIEFIFPKDQEFNRQTLGGVQLTPNQIKMLSEGHTILVEDMKTKEGRIFSSFVTQDSISGKMIYTRSNPETGEIYVPKEISHTQLTHEDRETLRKGGTVYLENMISNKGEEFSAFVRLNMTTGYPQYSRTQDGFNEQQAPKIPAEVFGHVFTAQEKANLQDGKAILVSGLKKNGGEEFSTYIKVSPNTGALNYFQENPDKPRNTKQNVQANNATQQQEQKKGAKQAV